MSVPVEVLVTVPFTEKLLDQLREVSPRIRLTVRPTRKADEISAEDWAKVEVLYTDRVLPQPGQAPNLRWVQFHIAGLDAVADADLLATPGVEVTTLSGAAAPQMAEFAVMMMLALGHKIPDLMANQAKAEWPRDKFERFSPVELRGSTVGLVGYGSIGRQIARLLQPFGAIVLAAKRDMMHPEDTGYIQEGIGDPAGDFFQRLYPIQALRSMLPACDFIVITLPLTDETRGVMGASELAACKQGAFLVDVSRGGIIHPPALIAALQEKRLAGAALDVFAEEPLPAESPLWKMPNVIITPHISGSSASYNDRAMTLFTENLNRYLLNLPLYNRFDPERGY